MISTHPKRGLDRSEWVDMLRFSHPSLHHAPEVDEIIIEV